MYAVGRLGSYITRGVYTVSSPFHPFSGAVDVIVVEQQDGSFKSSPWYVQFGKFQGVLKAREKVVSINVNGVDADFHMYLDNKGEAYFLREVDGEERSSELNLSSSGDDTGDKSSSNRRPERIKSCNYDPGRATMVSEVESPKGKIMSQSKSTGPKIFGLLFRPGSAKENGLHYQEGSLGVHREGSLERAEIAANLLAVRWSTNLASSKRKKGNSLRFTDLMLRDGGRSQRCYCVKSGSRNVTDCNHDKGGISLSTSPGNYMEAFSLEETYLELNLVSDNSRSSSQTDGIGSNQANGSEDSDQRTVPEISKLNSVDIHSVELQSNGSGIFSGDEKCNTFKGPEAAHDSRQEKVNSVVYCETSKCFNEGESNGCNGEPFKSLCIGCSACEKVGGTAQAFCDSTELRSDIECEVPSKIVGCKMDKNVESVEIKNSCEPLIESNYYMGENSSVIASNDVESDLVTEVGIVEETEHSYQELRLTNSSIRQGPVDPSFGAQEEAISEDHCTPSSSNLHYSVLCKNNGLNKDAFPEETAGIGPSSEEQFLMADLQKIHHTEMSGSIQNELNIEDISESSEERVDESSDILDVSDLATVDVKQDGLSHLEVSRTLSNPISIVGVHNHIDDTAQTAESLPSLWSNSSTKNVHSINHPLSRSLDSNFGTMKFIEDDILASLETEAERKQQSASDSALLKDSQIAEDLRNILSEPAVEISLCGHLLSEGMGYEAAADAFNAEMLDMEKLASLGPDIIKNDRLIVRIGGLYFPWDAAVPIVSMIGSSEQVLEPKGMIAIDQVEKGVGEELKKSTGSKKFKWTLWPFSGDGSNSMDGRQSTPVKAGNNTKDMPLKRDICEAKAPKKKVLTAKAPTSEQLASLNLREGKNTVTFTFSTPMLGEQKIDARIFLWKWNARIVISDVDGTITKSDVLGQFMPLMGIDWSQTGVAHLFSAIKENGYELLFLSARAIAQAYTTRQFLFNLKQDGKALPEGPVVISPDGLFPSLFREVIRRAPHEFKIACLEDIKALFPSDSNPFYAGFGNRDTDEMSYLKVGIPRGKIFIINPRGEVAVHRRVDTRSYLSLHTLVHNMFPPPSSSYGTEQEDYNSWNFWRLPPRDISA